MTDQVILNQVCSFKYLRLQGAQCQGKLKVYYFEIRIRAFLFGLLQNQHEIAENYLLKFILTAKKCNKFFCQWTHQILSKNNDKIIKNVSLIA